MNMELKNNSMGIFNYVKFKCKCPNCGEIVNDFQTKDGAAFFEVIDFYEVSNFYAECSKCKTWLDFTLKPQYIRGITNYEAKFHLKTEEEYESKIFEPELEI